MTILEHKIFPEKLVHPNVEILLLNDCDIQGTCFQGMKELKVLSLTSFSSCVISLYALTSLRKLRVLHLAFFEDLSYLGKLTTLEILSLRTPEFEGLADELVRLVNLKILDLTGCRFSSRFHPNVIRRLSKLEELYLKGSSIGEESDDILLEIKFLTRLTALSLSISSSHFIEDFEFPRLEEYNIFLRGTQDKLGCPHPEQWGKFLEEAARKISYEIQGLNSVVNLTKRSLKIEGVFPYNVVSQLLENLESLQVFDIKDEYIEGLTDQTQQIVSVSVILQNLKQVRIENCMNLEVVFQTEKVEGNEAPPLLSNLKSLRLKRLIDLSCIWELPTQHVRLESLVDLRIEDCPSLKSLFSVSLAQGLDYTTASMACLPLTSVHNTETLTLRSSQRYFVFSLILVIKEVRKNHGRGGATIEKASFKYIFPTKIAAQGLRVSTLFIKNCCRLKQVIRVAKDMVENDIMFQQLQFLRSLSSFSVSGCPQITDSVVHLDAEEAYLECLLTDASTLHLSQPASPRLFPFRNNKHHENWSDVAPVGTLPSILSNPLGIRLSAFKESFSGSKHLQLSEIEDQNLVPEANREGLNGLTSLELSQCKDLDCLVDTTTMNELTSAFTHLERLSINYMDGLESLCKGHPPQGFLKNLKELLIRDCNKLQVVLSMDELLYNRVPLSKLQSLELENLPDLRWLFKGSPHSFIFQSLKVVNIGGCGELKSLFSPSLIQSLVLLEKLQIRSCDELKTLLAEPENDDEMESKSSSLPLCLPNLKTLYIHHCSKLEYVVPITLAQGLPSLESVSISQCYELKQVFGMSKEQDGVQHDGLLLLASLQHLNLEWLLKLTSFVPQNYTVKAPALKRFYVYDCPQLMNSPIQHVHKKLELRLESVGLAAFKELFGNTINLLVHRVWDDKILIPDLENLEHHSQAMMGFKYNGEPSEGCFPNLKSLRVKNCVNLLKVFEIAEGLYNQEENQAPQILSKLEYLELYYLLDLRQIVKGPTRYVNLQSLKVLDIIRCSEPKSLFPLSVSQTLSSLEELNIQECGELLQGGDFIPNPKKMELFNLIWLRDNLRELIVHYNNNLTYIFPVMLIQHLSQLSILEIKSCEKLKGIIGNDDILASSSQGPRLEMKMVFPQLKQIVLEDLPKLESFIPVGYHLEFPCLDLLNVKQCSKIITSFTADYLTLTVHAKTDQASQLDDASPSQEVIFWKRRRPTLLPQYIEETGEINSPLK
ncbi:hypothetical protein GOBAR_AA25153 [Gossypium barbadense]|uniref:Disease resistance protein At4g27190-like leucine-rich repeats domain-containing protein n=1 Tax=Gossypium barbadense TaxID=3634 RepID=A0A2P5WWP4_GOSBA|nr:hypothetical protein GOBAR_AA25153 [Gossypium barbadense]